MKKRDRLRIIFLVIYVVAVMGFYFWLIYPALSKPKQISPTKIPSLSVSELTNASKLLDSVGKVWNGTPSEPDLNNYVFGQKDPI